MTDSGFLRLLRKHLSDEALEALQSAQGVVSPEDYDETLRAATQRSRGLEELVLRARRTANKLSREIADIPAGRLRVVLENSSPLMLLALAHETIQASFAARFDHPRQSLRLAELGLAAAERACASNYLDSPAQADLMAEAWLYLANARRITSDLPGADEAFERADDFQLEGTGDRHLKAVSLSLEASLRFSQGRIDRAAELLDREIRLRRLLDEREELGYALINRGIVATWSEPLAGACDMLSEGASLIDNYDYLVLTLGPVADRLARDGEGLLAFRVICRAEAALGLMSGESHKLRLRWARGITYRTLGQLESAERILRGVREELVRQDSLFKAALASLDLAAVYVAQGRWREVKEIVEEAYAVFVAERLERRALAAFLSLRLAARGETLTEALAIKVANFLVRSQYDRTLRFDPPSER